MNLDGLKRILPHAPHGKLEEYLPHLVAAMAEFEINTPVRQAAFLGQLAHESGEFRWMEELWGPTKQQERYEPPCQLAHDLGNTQPGDGKRYKGRGPIQVTGRANYRMYGKLLGLDLEALPEQVSTPAVGFAVAAAFWKTHGLNELADDGDYQMITRRINGGLTGYDDRVVCWERAKDVLTA